VPSFLVPIKVAKFTMKGLCKECHSLTRRFSLQLSESLVSRMKDLPQPLSESSSSISAGPDQQGGNSVTLKHSGTEEQLYRRYEKAKAMAKEDLSKLDQQEQVVAIAELKEHVTSAEEQQNIKQLRQNVNAQLRLFSKVLRNHLSGALPLAA
ncbi:hypothetical protein scyTo_0018401, partial [Scyliorhinus torazame]|nr:hypothetical protein [Scyliorhinus torazame]